MRQCVYLYQTYTRDAIHEIFERTPFRGTRENLQEQSKEWQSEKGREVRTKDLWFPRGVPAQRRSYRGTAVHYFLMSNKAISMCPDQGPQVLTRVISPGSPACATSSSERRTLLSSPFSATFRPVAPHAGRWLGHVTTLHPQRQGTLRKSESADQQEEDGGSKGRGRGLGGEKSRGGEEKVVSTK